MPTIPLDIDIPDFRGPTLNPAAAGVAGDALARAGGQVANVASDFEDQVIASRREVQTAQSIAATTGALDDSRYQFQKMPDATAAKAGFLANAQNLIQQQTSAIDDPLVKARVSAELQRTAGNMAIDVHQTAFGVEASSHLANLDQMRQQYANLYGQAPNDFERDDYTNKFGQAVDSYVGAGYLSPDQGEKQKQGFASNLTEQGILQERNAATATRDPMKMLALADKVNDPTQYPGLLPEDRERIGEKLYNLGHTYMQTQLILDEKNASMAERNLRQAQDRNAVSLISDIYAGKPVTLPQIAAAGQNGLLSAGGMESAHSALVQGREGIDDPPTLQHLYDQLGGGADIGQSAGAALAAGQLSTPKYIALMNANREQQDKTFPDANAKANYDRMMTGLGADKVKAGLFTDPNTPLLISQAQGEYFQRTHLGHEDPAAVADDVLGRYIKTMPTIGALPNPRLGMVQKPDDVAAVWARTRDAYAAGQLNEAQYETEGRLLKQYQAIFDDQKRRAQATAGTGSTKPTPGVSLQPAGDQ